MPKVQRLLEELSNAHGPSGFEEPVRAIMRREFAPLADDLDTDGVGSLIARFKGTSDAPRVMMAAHMDEVGHMVKYITPDGFIKFQALGGVHDQSIINQRWVILTQKGIVRGVTGLKTVHVIPFEERNQPFKRQDMFIDVGAASKKDAEERLGIFPGDPISPDSTFVTLNDGGLYLGKAWDDRVGLAIMIGVARLLRDTGHPNTVFAVSTVQEEVGLRGAQTSSFQVGPDIGINLESGVASDYPGTSQNDAQERLGDGPAIFLHDSSMLPNRKFRDLVMSVAKENRIPVQFNVLAGYGQDGSAMQRNRGGVPAINISVPTRYLHSHNGVISRADFDRAVTLVAAVVRKLDAPTVKELKSFA